MTKIHFTSETLVIIESTELFIIKFLINSLIKLSYPENATNTLKIMFDQ